MILPDHLGQARRAQPVRKGPGPLGRARRVIVIEEIRQDQARGPQRRVAPGEGSRGWAGFVGETGLPPTMAFWVNG